MAGGLCSTHYTSSSEHFALNILKNIGLLKHLKMISLNPADPNKKKYPRKFDTKILTPKSRQAKSSLVKTNFCLFFKQFATNSPVFFYHLEMLSPW